MLPRVTIIVILILAGTGISWGNNLAKYYKEMSRANRSSYPTLRGKLSQPLNGRNVFLVVGDILTFVGPRSKVEFPIDALIVSTNDDLNFDAASPRIQKNLHARLSESTRKKIRKQFGPRGHLEPTTEPLVVDLGDFSPRHICFLATDRRDGGTYNDPKWQKHLEFDQIAVGVKRCLEQLEGRKVRTIVAPLIGSSINPSVEDKKYIETKELRVEHIERRIRSLTGIVSGLKTAKPGQGEFAIVVWNKDIIRIIDPELIEKKRYREEHYADGFWGLRKQMLSVFKSAKK